MRRLTKLATITRGLGVEGSGQGVILATERPVERWDEQRGEVVKEILLLSGIEWRGNQLPVVDSHNRVSVRNIYGSVRALRVNNGRLVGQIYWARDARSQVIKEKWIDGHLTDFSITASPLEITEYAKDQVWNGIAGPINLATRWEPIDASIVCSGADPECRS